MQTENSKTSRFPIPITKDSFAYSPGMKGVTELLRSVNFLQNILPSSVPLMSILSEKQIQPEYIAEGETILANNISKMFKLESGTDPTQFILSQLKTANNVTEYIRQKLNIPMGRLNDEIDMEDPLILRTMALHLRKTNKSKRLGEKPIEPKVSYELRRQLLLAIIAGRLHTNTINNKAHEFLSTLQYDLNKHFYSDEITGATTKKRFITKHNPKTNEVEEYRDMKDETTLAENEKSVLFHFRHITLDNGEQIEVYSKDRKKGDVEAIIKSITKAGNREISPHDDVEDTMGKRFVVNGEDDVRDKFMDKYLQTIKQLYPDAKIIPDSPKQKKPGEVYRGQSDKTDYNRVKIYFNGKSTPYEVICYSLKNFLNSKVDVGSLNKQGEYDGYGHLMFEYRRLKEAAKILYPKELYNYDIDSLIQIAMQNEAQQLLASKVIDYE